MQRQSKEEACHRVQPKEMAVQSAHVPCQATCYSRSPLNGEPTCLWTMVGVTPKPSRCMLGCSFSALQCFERHTCAVQ